MAPRARTRVSLSKALLKRLRAYQIEGKSLEDVIQDLVETVPPQSFWERYNRLTATETYRPCSELRKEMKL